MKTKETSISECMICGSHQLTSLGSRCKYPTANGCCDGEMQLLYKSTREQALAWWKTQGQGRQNYLTNTYIGNQRFSYSLTGREIEEIWLREIQNQSEERTVEQNFYKPNQKQFKIAKQIAENSTYGADSKNHPINRKQFVEFNESLFKAYIDKFSDEDKLKALSCLYMEIPSQLRRKWKLGK